MNIREEFIFSSCIIYSSLLILKIRGGDVYYTQIIRINIFVHNFGYKSDNYYFAKSGTRFAYVYLMVNKNK